MAVTIKGIQGVMEAGTYTPTLSAGVNIGTSTPRLTKYIRVGNVVYVTGEITIDPTAGAPTITTFELDVPIASNFGTVYDLSGVCTGSVYTQCGSVSSSVANNTAVFYYNAVNAGVDAICFHFAYEII